MMATLQQMQTNERNSTLDYRYFTWSSTSNVTGGGTVSYLDVVTGESSTFQYIKKYEGIPMTVVAGTNNRAWKPTDTTMQH